MGISLYNLKESKKFENRQIHYKQMTSLGYPYSVWGPTHYVLFESIKELIIKKECEPDYLKKIMNDDNGKINGEILKKVLTTNFYNEFRDELNYHIEEYNDRVDSLLNMGYDSINSMDFFNFKEIKIDPDTIISTIDIIKFIEKNKNDGIAYF
jgi:hypothetical protein